MTNQDFTITRYSNGVVIKANNKRIGVIERKPKEGFTIYIKNLSPTKEAATVPSAFCMSQGRVRVMESHFSEESLRLLFFAIAHTLHKDEKSVMLRFHDEQESPTNQ